MPDRVRSPTGSSSTSTWPAVSGNLPLPRVRPLLRVGPRRQVHRQAQDTEQAPVAQVDSAAPRRVAVDAYAAGRAASLVLPRAAGSLLLGQHAAQRAFTQRVPTGSPTHLIHLPPVTQPEESAHAPGLVRGTNRGLVFTTTSNHPPLHIASGALRVTSRKNWARESRLPGTVRAEPKGRANRPRSRSGRGARGGFDRLYGRIG